MGWNLGGTQKLKEILAFLKQVNHFNLNVNFSTKAVKREHPRLDRRENRNDGNVNDHFKIH